MGNKIKSNKLLLGSLKQKYHSTSITWWSHLSLKLYFAASPSETTDAEKA